MPGADARQIQNDDGRGAGVRGTGGQRRRGQRRVRAAWHDDGRAIPQVQAEGNPLAADGGADVPQHRDDGNVSNPITMREAPSVSARVASSTLLIPASTQRRAPQRASEVRVCTCQTLV